MAAGCDVCRRGSQADSVWPLSDCAGQHARTHWVSGSWLCIQKSTSAPLFSIIGSQTDASVLNAEEPVTDGDAWRLHASTGSELAGPQQQQGFHHSKMPSPWTQASSNNQTSSHTNIKFIPSTHSNTPGPRCAPQSLVPPKGCAWMFTSVRADLMQLSILYIANWRGFGTDKLVLVM